MRKTTFILLFFTTVCYAFTCNKASTEAGCTPTSLAVKTLETEYGCTNTAMQLGINLSDTFTIIESQTQFTTLVSGCTPNVDFSQYSLLIGKKRLNGGLQSISYELKDECANGYVLNVKFTKSLASNAPNVTYHVLLPKLSNNKPVTVNTAVL